MTSTDKGDELFLLRLALGRLKEKQKDDPEIAELVNAIEGKLNYVTKQEDERYIHVMLDPGDLELIVEAVEKQGGYNGIYQVKAFDQYFRSIPTIKEMSEKTDMKYYLRIFTERQLEKY